MFAFEAGDNGGEEFGGRVPGDDGIDRRSGELPGMDFLPINREGTPQPDVMPEPSRDIDVRDFIVLHDGTQEEPDDTEKAAVRTAFDSLVQDMLLAHVDHTIPVQESDTSSPEASLSARIPVNDAEYYSILISARTGRNDDDPELALPASRQVMKEVMIVHIVESTGRSMYSWVEDGDGVVRRFTDTDVRATVQRLEETGLFDEESTFEGDIRNMTEYAAAEVPNSELAQAMGYQNQPVGLGEIEGLADFLHQPGLETER